ncbi:uncharacterized protein LOC128458961 [Pleuronectes platessa]|uniref:uncharacterized protein LOC128458961 n=1 Tax=Pleuronectes platessa TaxID=8262 RepID=UPI00232A345F|nr:uncharacterized protein LOC128458961 [Pleuronectes platessa]
MKTRGSILLPSPFLCFINPFDPPLFSVLQCRTSHRRRPIAAFGLPLFSFPSSTPSGPLYIPHHYIQQSVQCAAREPAGSVQRNSQRGRERRGKCQTANVIREANAAAGSPDPPAHTIEMGCTTGHLACQPQPQTGSGQDSQALEGGGAKVPDVLSSLERLSQATGGMEKSWYRCIFPFGIISLVIGVAGTGVTYTYNDLPQTKVVSVVLLVMGILLLLMATACWTAHNKKRRKKKEGGSFTSEQCPL